MTGGRQAILILLLAGLSLANEVCKSRKKRYLAFPDKSNLALTITLLKPTAFMNGVNTLHEIDLGVPLPRSPHRILARASREAGRHRMALYGQLEAVLDMFGLSGAVCLERAMCEVQLIKRQHLERSVFLQILKTVFTMEGVTFANRKACSENCPLSMFHPSLLLK